MRDKEERTENRDADRDRADFYIQKAALQRVQRTNIVHEGVGKEQLCNAQQLATITAQQVSTFHLSLHGEAVELFVIEIIRPDLACQKIRSVLKAAIQ